MVSRDSLPMYMLGAIFVATTVFGLYKFDQRAERRHNARMSRLEKISKTMNGVAKAFTYSSGQIDKMTKKQKSYRPEQK